MAAALKENQTSNTNKRRLAQSFKERLDRLGCPFTDGVDESWISELLFKPGEHRIRLLQWLFSKFDSRLNDVLEPQFASVESKMDSRVQRLLYTASALGLCRYDDVDLIRGVNVKPARQTAFLDQLLDHVCIIDAAEDPQNKALRIPGVVSDAMNLDEQFMNDCTYMDTLVHNERIDSIFNQNLMLLPPDLQRQVEVAYVQEGYQRDKPPKPDLQNLAETANTLSKDLERQTEILQELTSTIRTVTKLVDYLLKTLISVILYKRPMGLNAHLNHQEKLKRTYDYQEPDESRMEKVSRTMQLLLSELSQLVVGFSYCYENEMSHWCNKSPPDLTQLGPALKRVHTLLQQFVNLLHGYQLIRNSYTNLTRDSEQRVKSISKKHKNIADLASASETVLSDFQDAVNILDQSLQRRECDSSMVSSTSSLLRM